MPLPGAGEIGRVKFTLRSFSSIDSPRPTQKVEMSATLFGRGVMTQVGGRQRAEATDNAIKAIRAEITVLQTLATQVRILEARLQATERKVVTLEADLAKVSSAVAAAPASTA